MENQDSYNPKIVSITLTTNQLGKLNMHKFNPASRHLYLLYRRRADYQRVEKLFLQLFPNIQIKKER